MSNGDSYTIDIPGASDIFKFTPPSLEDENLKRERIQRLKTKQSPVPGALGWIPPIINYLDDAQDILYTGLVLAKPLLRRLPARFVPYLGWLLLASDTVNLITAIASIPLTGTSGKRIKANMLDLMNTGRHKGVSRVPDFMARTRFLPFALQAGQAVETLTGYGVILGPIMGLVSDTIWGTIRTLQGKRVDIRTPPPSDPAAKAARFLMQSGQEFLMPDAYSQEDLQMLIMARNVAVGLLGEDFSETIVESRADDFARTELPVFYPWNLTSQRMLEAQDIIYDHELYNYISPAGVYKTFQDKIQEEARNQYKTQVHLRKIYSDNPSWGQITQHAFNESGLAVFGSLGAITDRPVQYLLPYEIASLRISECGFTVDSRTDPMDTFLYHCAVYRTSRIMSNISWCWIAVFEAKQRNIKLVPPQELPAAAPPRGRRPKRRGTPWWTIPEDFLKGSFLRPDGTLRIDYIGGVASYK